MNKQEIVNTILYDRNREPSKHIGHAFAPSNIALTKYWGKRDNDIILPNTPSLSISLGHLGTTTTICPADHDVIIFNGRVLDSNDKIAKRILEFTDLIRPSNLCFKINTTNNIPTGAGVASSASGGAALVLAYNNLFNWNLEYKDLSILARLISGSACRSIYQNSFVIWQKGKQKDGLDSYAYPLENKWHNLRIGILLISQQEKAITSRYAMKNAHTSPYYRDWIAGTTQDTLQLQKLITSKNFNLFGQTIEKNSNNMHKIMQSQIPPVNYFLPKTHRAIEEIKALRQTGIEVYYTMDAGPNIKLIYEYQNEENLRSHFPHMIGIKPFPDDQAV